MRPQRAAALEDLALTYPQLALCTLAIGATVTYNILDCVAGMSALYILEYWGMLMTVYKFTRIPVVLGGVAWAVGEAVEWPMKMLCKWMLGRKSPEVVRLWEETRRAEEREKEGLLGERRVEEV